MSEPRTSGPSETPEELATALRAKARAAATAALREGLVDVDNRYGQHVADEVVGLLDIAEIFNGLVEPGRASADSADADNDGADDDRPYELNTKYEW